MAYARVNTEDQNLALQEDALQQAEREKIYQKGELLKCF
jgi:DNA invertase Pin-like site-specific DNA recombinase